MFKLFKILCFSGKLEHEYEVEKMAGGLKFVRTHRSSKEVLRHHTKVTIIAVVKRYT